MSSFKSNQSNAKIPDFFKYLIFVFLISPALLPDLIKFRSIEPYLFALGSLCLFYLAFLPKPIKLNHEKVFIYLFWILVFIQTIFSVQKNFIPLALLTSYIAVFSFIRKIISVTIIKLFLIVFIILTGFSCFVFWVGYNQFNVPFILPNKSVYGIYIASFLPFVLCILPFEKSLNLSLLLRTLLYTGFALASILVVVSNSRSAWVSCFFASFFLYISNKRRSSVLMWICFFVVVTVITTVFFYYKFDSSRGRLLIYKISFQIFKDHWILGIGSDHFRSVYNIYQANYFQHHDINSHQAFLADEATYVFNDYLQLAIEQGLIGLTLIVTPFILTIRRILKASLFEKHELPLSGSIASILIILVSGFTSYPFEIIPVVINLIFYLALIDSHLDCRNNTLNINFPTKFMFGIAIMLCFYSIFLITNETKGDTAFALSEEGYQNKALGLYKKVNYLQTQKREMLYNYAITLNNTHQLKEALQIIERAKLFYTAPKVFSLCGSIYQEIESPKKAEENYCMAVYICPNRITNRMQLANFYLQMNQKQKAKYWLDLILKMPIKVKSSTTDLYLQKAKALRDSLN